MIVMECPYMVEVKYRGLPEFGLPLIAQDDPVFALLANAIEVSPGPEPGSGLERAAVFLNNTDKAIVAVA